MSVRKELLNKIKSRGYWNINFKPIPYNPQRINNLPDCKKLVEENTVEFRGWDYPHFPIRTGDDAGLIAGDNYYEGWIDWHASKEIWRMYQSGQFIHYLSFREDWAADDPFFTQQIREIPPNTVLSVNLTICQLTEIFEFLARLTRKGIYDDNIKVDINLHNTQNRKLLPSEPMRVSLFERYSSDIQNIPFSNIYQKEEILIKPLDLALNTIVYFFNRFKWDTPPIEVIKSKQLDLISRNR